MSISLHWATVLACTIATQDAAPVQEAFGKATAVKISTLHRHTHTHTHTHSDTHTPSSVLWCARNLIIGALTRSLCTVCVVRMHGLLLCCCCVLLDDRVNEPRAQTKHGVRRCDLSPTELYTALKPEMDSSQEGVGSTHELSRACTIASCVQLHSEWVDPWPSPLPSPVLPSAPGS